MRPFAEFSPPPEAEIDHLWDEGLISVDANILLSLYDLSPASRAKLLGYFQGLDEGRLWVAHQAMVEFHRHRLARREQVGAHLKEVATNVRAAAKDVKRQLGRYASLAGTFEPLAKPLERAANAVDQERSHYLKALGEVDDDAVVKAMEKLLDDKVGIGLPRAYVEREGEHRFAREIPPGFADAEAKGLAHRYGDLHIWLELLSRAKAEQRPVMLLTQDSKDDWWWNSPGRRPVPRPELRREMHDVAGVAYWQYTLDTFLRLAASRGLITDEDVADEIEGLREGREHVLSPLSIPSGETWPGNVVPSVRTPPHVRPRTGSDRLQQLPLHTLAVIAESENAAGILCSWNVVTFSRRLTQECRVRTPSGSEFRCEPSGDYVSFPRDFTTAPVEAGHHLVWWDITLDEYAATVFTVFTLPFP